MKRIKAIYDGGVLKPLEQLSLADQQVVTLFLPEADDLDLIDEVGDDVLDFDAMVMAEIESEGAISLEELRERLTSIRGSMSDAVDEDRGEY